MSFQTYGWGPPTLTGGLLESETEPRELSAEFVLVVPVSSTLGFLSLPLHWVSFAFCFHHVSFPWVGLLLCLAPPCGAHLMGPRKPRLFQPGEIRITVPDYVREVCNFLGSVSLQQRFETADQRYSWFTAQFYLASKGQYTLKAWEQVDPKGKALVCLGFLLLYICLLPALSLPYANWNGQEGGLFVSLEVLISFRLAFLLFHFCGLFPFFVF